MLTSAATLLTFTDISLSPHGTNQEPGLVGPELDTTWGAFGENENKFTNTKFSTKADMCLEVRVTQLFNFISFTVNLALGIGTITSIVEVIKLRLRFVKRLAKVKQRAGYELSRVTIQSAQCDPN